MSERYGAPRAAAISLLMATLLATTVTGQPARADDTASPLICVLVPHFKDEYWLSVGYGLEQEAARLNARLYLAEAGGYRARQHQIAQLSDCVAQHADAVLIGTVTSDHPALLAAVARVAGEAAPDRAGTTSPATDAPTRGLPVLALVNRLDSPVLSGRIGVDWRDMGRAAGRYLAQRHPAGGPPRTALFVTGPAEAGWSAPVEEGLREELARSAVTIIAQAGADTGLRPQFAAVSSLLAAHPDADYLIGPAPAIEAAMGMAAATPGRQHPALVSTYMSHTIRRGLMDGQVAAAPFDDPVTQGEQALRLAVNSVHARQSNPEPATAPQAPPQTPVVTILSAGEPGLARLRLSPANWFPRIP